MGPPTGKMYALPFIYCLRIALTKKIPQVDRKLGLGRHVVDTKNKHFIFNITMNNGRGPPGLKAFESYYLFY